MKIPPSPSLLPQEEPTHLTMFPNAPSTQPQPQLPPTRQPPSIPLICLGRHLPVALALEESLAPHFHYPAILTSSANLSSTLPILLDSLNPTPRGVTLGGGFDEEVVREVEEIVKAWQARREVGAEVKVLRVPAGTLEREGVEGLKRWVRAELGKVFGVEVG